MHTFAQKPKATQQTTSAKSEISGRGRFGQSPEVRSILHVQRTIGNQAVQRMSQTDAEEPEADLTRPASHCLFENDFSRIPIDPPAAGAIQTKLGINELRDSYEQDADRIAEQAIRMPEPQLQRACPCGGGCPRCLAEQPRREHKSIQTKRVQAGASGQIAAPPIVHEVLRSPGQPLDPATRAFMEPRFDHDFSQVRVHTSAAAEESARDVNAHAYTVGHDLVFGAGRFAPGTQQGRWLLAHELAHVMQQRHATANGPLSLGGPGDLAEQAAELAANGVMAGRQAAIPRGTENAERVVRRSPGPRTQSPPSPPEWLGPLRAGAIHLHGDIWDVEISGLGRSPVGPHDQMQSYLRVINQNRPPGGEVMQSAHIIGGEHIRDLGWNMPYNKAPCIGVAASLHDKWTREISNHQSQRGLMGGRTTATAGRPIVGPKDVKALHHEVYAGFPDLQDISQRIVNLEARRIMRAKYGMPKPASPMASHQGGTPKPQPAMPEPQSAMPKPESAMPKPQSAMPKPESAMPKPQSAMPKPQSGQRSGQVQTATPITQPVTKAEIGQPIKPTVEATPGFRPARGAGFGTAFQVLQAMQFGNLQQAEIAKFKQRLAELEPKIDAYFARDYSVQLILIVEKPDRPDFFCAAGVFCDASQFIYFRDLFINYAESVKPVYRPAAPSSHVTMGPPGGRSGEIPYTHQGGSIIELKEIPFLKPKYADHHCEFAKHTLYPPDNSFLLSPDVPRQPARPEGQKPQLDQTTSKALAAAPARVYVTSENIIQDMMADRILKKLAGYPLFGELKESMGGSRSKYTIVAYWSDLEESRAEALAEILRSEGVPSVRAERFSHQNGDTPGYLQINIGRDAETVLR